MSALSQFLGSVAGQVASSVILKKVMAGGMFGEKEPGYQLPIIVPPGAEVEGAEREGVGPTFSERFKIPFWAFATGYGALLWYAARATAPLDMPDPDLGDPDPQQTDLLFPALKRELTHLDVEDLATSDDPVEACLERAGWKLPRIDELRESIFDKQQTTLFDEPEPLDRSEEELTEAIEVCMQKLETQYGSLEAAGVGCSLCSDDDPDLGVVQREMFDPEQTEIDFSEPPEPRERSSKEVATRLNDYLESLEPGQEPVLDAAVFHVYRRKGKKYKEALLARLYTWGFKNWTNFKATMENQGRWTRE